MLLKKSLRGYGKHLGQLTNRIESGAVEDVNSVARHLLGLNCVSAVGVYGESWGGYLAALVVTSSGSDLYAGGASMSGFYDWHLDYECTTKLQNIGYAAPDYRTRFGFVPTESTDTADHLSINRQRLSHLAVPLSILHGGKDLDVPVIQAEKLRSLVEETQNKHVTVTINPEANHRFSGYEFEVSQHTEAFFRQVFGL